MNIHRKVQSLINEEKTKINDKQFFTSFALRRHFEDIAYGITKKYGNERISVDIDYVKYGATAYTTGRKVYINAGDSLLDGTDRAERYKLVYGLFSHENGHILYTDFTILEKMKNNILTYHKFYPDFPKEARYDAEVGEIKSYLMDTTKSSIIKHLLFDLHNIVEDGHIENRMMFNYTGDVKRSLLALRKVHLDSIPTVSELEAYEEKEEDIISSILQNLLSYAKFGKIKFGDADVSNERIQAVFSVLDEVDMYLVTNDALKRAELGNLIFIKLWCYYKPMIDRLAEQSEQNRQYPQQQGSSRQGSGGTPMASSDKSQLGDTRNTTQIKQIVQKSYSQLSQDDEEDDNEGNTSSAQSSNQSTSQKDQNSGESQSDDEEQGEETQTAPQTGTDVEDSSGSSENSTNEDSEDGNGSTDESADESDPENDTSDGEGESEDNSNEEDQNEGDDNANDDNSTTGDNGADGDGEETFNGDDNEFDDGEDTSNGGNEENNSDEADVVDEEDDFNDFEDEDDGSDEANDFEDESNVDDTDGTDDCEDIFTDSSDGSHQNDNSFDSSYGMADDVEGDGEFSFDDEYEGESDIDATSTINELLEAIAEEKATKVIEKEIKSEAGEIAEAIDYGNIHKNCKFVLHRQVNVSDSLIETYNIISPELLSIAKGLVKTVEQKLKDYQQGGKFTNLYFGRRIDKNNLVHTDGKIFYNNRLPQDLPQLSIGVLVDESNSMRIYNRSVYARATASIVYEFCQQLHIPITIIGHSAEEYWGSSSTTMHFFDYCEFNSIDGKDKYRLMDIKYRGYTRDGAALRYIMERLVERPEEQKILFVISDGKPCSNNYTGEPAKADIRSIVREYEKKGIKTVACAIGSDKKEILSIYGENRFLDITDLSQLPRTMIKKIINSLKIS